MNRAGRRCPGTRGVPPGPSRWSPRGSGASRGGTRPPLRRGLPTSGRGVGVPCPGRTRAQLRGAAPWSRSPGAPTAVLPGHGEGRPFPPSDGVASPHPVTPISRVPQTSSDAFPGAAPGPRDSGTRAVPNPGALRGPPLCPRRAPLPPGLQGLKAPDPRPQRSPLGERPAPRPPRDPGEGHRSPWCPCPSELPRTPNGLEETSQRASEEEAEGRLGKGRLGLGGDCPRPCPPRSPPPQRAPAPRAESSLQEESWPHRSPLPLGPPARDLPRCPVSFFSSNRAPDQHPLQSHTPKHTSLKKQEATILAGLEPYPAALCVCV